MHYSTPSQKQRYSRLMAEYRAALGGRCVACGSTEGLEFDHVDPATKAYSIGDVWSSPDKVYAELPKCQLLCVDCHKVKTDTAQLAKRRHGTWGAVTNGKCKCDECRAFVNKYNRERKRKLKQAGRSGGIG